VEKFWIRCAFFQKFALGDPWEHARFEVEAEEINIEGEVGFVVLNPKTKVWWVYHAKTGGLLAKHVTKWSAILQARANVKGTPDFKDQLALLGPLDNLPTVDASKAWQEMAE
jgi:hypothetical protein